MPSDCGGAGERALGRARHQHDGGRPARFNAPGAPEHCPAACRSFCRRPLSVAQSVTVCAHCQAVAIGLNIAENNVSHEVSLAALQLLLDNSADVNVKESTMGLTMLQMAMMHDRIDMMGLLLLHGRLQPWPPLICAAAFEALWGFRGARGLHGRPNDTRKGCAPWQQSGNRAAA